MIPIELHQFFNFFIAFVLFGLFVLWIRRISRGNKRWRVSEDSLINCRECGVKFITAPFYSSAECPNCGQKCQLRWQK